MTQITAVAKVLLKSKLPYPKACAKYRKVGDSRRERFWISSFTCDASLFAADQEHSGALQDLGHSVVISRAEEIYSHLILQQWQGTR
jgi:hypothetical protein